MASTAGTVLTYGDNNVVEDVSNLIEIISPKENYFLNSLRKTRAIARTHDTQTDSLTAPTLNGLAVAEGNDAADSGYSTPSRVSNITEVIQKAYKVSGSARAVQHYAGGDELLRQREKSMIEVANSMEFDLLRSTSVSGVSGTIQKMAGIIAGITTNLTAQTSGTVYSESILNGLLQDVYTNGNGESPDVIAVGALMKRKISGFTTNVTRNVDASGKRQINALNIYDSDFGTHEMVLHRYVQQSGDATARVLMVKKDNWAIAYLRNLTREPLAKVGDADREQIVGEFTVENINEKTSSFASGYLLAA